MDHPDGALEQIRQFWDADAATYDRSSGHRPRHPAVVSAWAEALASLLPPPPCRVLDCGAGTGFLSLIAARAGHEVTALDLAPAMLAELQTAAARAGLAIQTVVAAAHEVPPGPFDVVIERHLLWTLPDPLAAMQAWRQVGRRLIAVESIWGDTAGLIEKRRAELRRRLRQRRGTLPDHHGEYASSLRRSLRFGSGTPPREMVQLVEAAGWSAARWQRLGIVEAAERRAQPLPERLLGVSPRFAVTARA